MVSLEDEMFFVSLKVCLTTGKFFLYIVCGVSRELCFFYLKDFNDFRFTPKDRKDIVFEVGAFFLYRAI